MDVLLSLIIAGAVLFAGFKINRSAAKNRRPSSRPAHQAESSSLARVSYSSDIKATHQDSSKLNGDPRKFWMPAGQPVDVAGRHIEGGLVYVGSGLSSAGYGHEPEAALINPELKVGDPLACDAAAIPYWPTYAGLSPACRAGYLDWLAGGRRDPQASISFVFLYFYGLERRVIADAGTVALPDTEFQAIRLEIKRLLALYGENQSFNTYASALLGYMTIAGSGEPVYRLPPPSEGKTWALPDVVRIAVGQLSRDVVPVPADWAFAWAWFDPSTYLRTPAERCRNEVQRLFAVRYRQRYGDGMVVKPCTRTVRYEYRAASRSVAGAIKPVVLDVPDVANLTGPIGKLRTLFDECTNDLDAYSRWLGRHPGSGGTLQASALLPAELTSTDDMGEEARELRTLLESATSGGKLAAIDAASILKFWPPARNGKYAKSDALALVQFLDKLGFGLEPDVRFGGPRLDSVLHVVAFLEGTDARKTPTTEYLSATLSLRLASAVAVADGVVTEAEQKSLHERIERVPALGASEQMRLRAHLEWLLAERPGLAGIKRKLESIESSARELLGQFLLTMAAADGAIAPEELKAISKLYLQLGLDPDSVYSDLHNMSFAADEVAGGPVTVRPAEQAKGYAIHAPESTIGAPRAPGRVVLDPRLVEAKRREAERATLLLSSIFKDEESPEPAPIPQSTAESSIAGLDAAHSDLLKCLVERDSWTMNEIEAEAAARGLMAEGALETINEAAWDSIDEAVLDLADDVSINRSAWEAMQA